jgi:alkylhydroperoxidase family enzyme
MKRTTCPRIAPLDPPYEPEVAAKLAKWMPPDMDAEPLKLFRTLAVHDQLMSRMLPLGAGILAHGRVRPRLREVMIHRTCALLGAEYEWGVHAAIFGEPLGFTDAQLRSTVHGSAQDAVWDRAEATVFRLADELHATSQVSAPLWQELRERFSDAEILELVITSGWYHLIGFVIATAGVEHEDWAPRFPQP